MDLTALAAFAAALFVAAASPGPNVAAVVARVLGRGTRGALAFTSGIALGDVVWLTFAITGLAVVAQTFQGVFLAVKYVGAAYLLWLAWKLWTAPARPAEVAAIAGDAPGERPGRLFLTGLALTMGNPKVMVFYLALLPSILDLGRVTPAGYAGLVVVTLAVLTVVLGGYVALSGRARRLLRSERALRLLNRGTGTVMAGAAVAVATR
jgi:threonine/homoserine/homoserine lactone efflux protein